ncbi:SWI/SNF COMPLEX-RELATED protein, putative [Babesia bigemina]|uniref:SWI/SNF COMPLEX-RELATED protein, putative n=1 Tax=Babesia bigemina TaxID=5866 RepID=A0A061D747_BABBI|nr:SWI/SNF COMPLEX-RELATED protein, putative [Babesia bigemina]CDR96348.1 SWI/SNF COMPLEX-RELATED protein, putative [Babesia bigemina]|eukprot:XP_012768534.1 SWI/SNF COMPLEX-RELATED protein, putative [Babesia bigemina]
MPLRRNCFVEFMRLEPKRDEREDAKCRISAPVQHWYDEKELNCIEREYVASILHDYCANTDDANSYYVDIRSKIIQLYNRDPARHLTSTDCIRCIDADPSTIAKVYCVLNYWGLINHGALRHLSSADEYLHQFKREIDTISHASSDADVGIARKEVDGASNVTPTENYLDCVDAINAPFTLERSLMDREISKKHLPQRTCQSCRSPCKYMYYMVETPADGMFTTVN